MFGFAIFAVVIGVAALAGGIAGAVSVAASFSDGLQ